MNELRNKNGLTEKEFLERYRPGDYSRPSVTVDNLIFTIDEKLNNLKILLIKRGDHPYMNCWALPGGFIDMNESAFEAANRELKEETGLEGIYLEQLYTYTQPKRDPRMRIIDIAYLALVPYLSPVAGDDASDAAWFDVQIKNNYLLLSNEEKNIYMKYLLEDKSFSVGAICYDNRVPNLVSSDRLAFDHDLIVYDGLMRLRNKAEYTDIVFNLMKKHFTLPDLQRVYEIILGRPLYKKNFRDKIKDRVQESEIEIRSVCGERASKAYTYKKITKTPFCSNNCTSL